jgi:hypothetical protein
VAPWAALCERFHTVEKVQDAPDPHAIENLHAAFFVLDKARTPENRQVA